MTSTNKFVRGAATTPESFWKRTNRIENGCIVWTGAVNKDGYGKVSVNYKTVLTHRYAYEITYGKTDKQVHHKCDNPKCVNPDHLWVGTQKDNMQDMVRKGRKARNGFPGEKHPKARLTEDDVRAIRKSTSTSSELAKQYKVALSTITHVRARINWKHVT